MLWLPSWENEELNVQLDVKKKKEKKKNILDCFECSKCGDLLKSRIQIFYSQCCLWNLGTAEKPFPKKQESCCFFFYEETCLGAGVCVFQTHITWIMFECKGTSQFLCERDFSNLLCVSLYSLNSKHSQKKKAVTCVDDCWSFCIVVNKTKPFYSRAFCFIWLSSSQYDLHVRAELPVPGVKKKEEEEENRACPTEAGDQHTDPQLNKGCRGRNLSRRMFQQEDWISQPGEWRRFLGRIIWIRRT